MVVNEMEYSVLAVAPFGPAATLSPARAIEITTAEDLDAAVAALAGTFRLAVPAALCPERTVAVSVSRLADFKPAGIAANCPYLRRVLEASALCATAAREGLPAGTLAARLRETWPGIPLDFSPPVAAAPGPPVAAGRDVIDAILDMVAVEAPRPGPGGDSGPAVWKDRLDRLAGALLEAILTDPAFRAAEAAWRGVRLMLREAGARCGLRLRLVAAGGAGLGGLLEELAGAPPAVPPGLVLVDAALDAAAARQPVWEALANLAATWLAPTAVALSPAFFHLDGWSSLSHLGYPARVLEEDAFAKWRRVASGPGGAWLAGLLPRAALRPGYGPDNPARVAPVRDGPLWGAPVWLLGAAVAASLARTGWPHRFERVHGVAVGDLAVVVEGARAMAVETLLSDTRLEDFVLAGLTPLAGRRDGDAAFFPRAVTLDGTDFAFRLFLGRVLGFFFRSRQDAALRELLEADGPQALTRALQARFDRFLRATGQAGPAALDLVAAPAADGLRLAVRFTPPAALACGGHDLECSFLW